MRDSDTSARLHSFRSTALRKPEAELLVEARDSVTTVRTNHSEGEGKSLKRRLPDVNGTQVLEERIGALALTSY